MLKRLVSLLGFSALAESVEYRLLRFADAAKETARAEARFYGGVAVLGTAAAAAAFVTFVAAVIVVVLLVERQWGQGAALAVAFLIPAAVTAALAAMVYLRVSTKEAPTPLLRTLDPPETPPAWRSNVTPEPPQAPRSTRSSFAVTNTQGELRTLLEGALGEFFRAPPATGTPLDRVVHRLTGEAAAASDRTVGLAADVLATGSRKVVFGILAGTAALGWFLARKPAGPAGL